MSFAGIARTAAIATCLWLAGCGGKETSSETSSETGGEAAATLSENVTTRNGRLEGYAENSALIYKGVPFAKPPVGDLRWRAPEEPEPWPGVRDAKRPASVCTQLKRTPQWVPAGSVSSPDGFVGAEDCLYLDIYRPQTDDRNLPVLVWIHGGGWTLGGATRYDGAPLAKRENIVVVVLQYRLGPMGAFSNSKLAEGEDGEDASGNFNILDQIQALKWVQRNIAAFGGDPAKVAIGGQSAGADNVYNLMLSPLAEGLFSRAVSMSGGLGGFLNVPPSDRLSNAMIDWLLQEDGTAPQKAEPFDNWEGAAAYREKMAPAALKDYLRGKSDFEIQHAAAEATGRLTGVRMIATAFPIMDGVVLPPVDAFDVIASGAYRQVPLMLGSTQDESKALSLLRSDFLKSEHGIPSGQYTWRALLYGVLIPEPEKLSLSDVLPTENDVDFYNNLMTARSRLLRAVQIDAVAKAFKTQTPAMPVYSYFFKWNGGGDPAVADYKVIYGAAHSADIPFWFGALDPAEPTAYSAFSYTAANRPGRMALTEAMMDYLGAFVRAGDPNPAGQGLPEWPEWTPDSPHFMVLDANMADAELSAETYLLTRQEVKAEAEAYGPLASKLIGP
ncbi:MAG: carboxylesterase/lipase family protein [Amphiplicatus sp.]